MLEIVNGRIYVEGVETINPELIGWALIDFAQSQEKDGMKIVFKEQDVFVESLITEF
jgi:ribosomal protein S19